MLKEEKLDPDMQLLLAAFSARLKGRWRGRHLTLLDRITNNQEKWLTVLTVLLIIRKKSLTVLLILKKTRSHNIIITSNWL